MSKHCFLAALLLLVIGSPTKAQERKDGDGEPLPDGVIARLGSVRLRMTEGGVFSPNGKTVAASGRLWNAATGHELRRLAPDKEWQRGSLQFSPDGKLLAVGIWKGIGLIDVASGKETWTAKFSDEYFAYVVAFCFID